MSTTVGTEREIKDLLGALIVLEYDTLEAYKSACARLDSTEARLQMGVFHADHERHVEELDRQMRSITEIPPNGPGLEQYLVAARVAFGGLRGDRAILLAIRDDEGNVRAAYERASARDDVPGHLRALFVGYLADENAHHEWLARQVSPSRQVSAARRSP